MKNPMNLKLSHLLLLCLCMLGTTTVSTSVTQGQTIRVNGNRIGSHGHRFGHIRVQPRTVATGQHAYYGRVIYNQPRIRKVPYYRGNMGIGLYRPGVGFPFYSQFGYNSFQNQVPLFAAFPPAYYQASDFGPKTGNGSSSSAAKSNAPSGPKVIVNPFYIEPEKKAKKVKSKAAKAKAAAKSKKKNPKAKKNVKKAAKKKPSNNAAKKALKDKKSAAKKAKGKKEAKQARKPKKAKQSKKPKASKQPKKNKKAKPKQSKKNNIAGGKKKVLATNPLLTKPIKIDLVPVVTE